MLAVLLAIVTWNQTAAASVGAKPKPISKQNCKELAKTDKRIQRDLAPNKPFKVQRKAGIDAGKVITRTNKLGGCLSKSAHKTASRNGPSGAPGDAGFTPTVQAAYLVFLTGDPILHGISPDRLVALGTMFCTDLDKGTSIAAESKVFIRMFKAQGLNANDAEMAFYDIASYAADDGTMSACNRHANQVEAYNQG